jgi:HK97 family phage prohead protease
MQLDINPSWGKIGDTMKTKKSDKNVTKLVCKDSFDIKQVGKEIVIEGFANKATIDRGDEIITTDAWELDNFKKNPIILFNHGMDTLGGTPVGKATEVRATDEGLFLKVKMSNSQSPGIKMVRDLVEERILKAFSVGFSPKESDMVEHEGKAIRKISKAELFEVSIVGVPMNQDSLFELSAKSLSTKSFHQVKSEILKAKGADKAIAMEELLGSASDRKGIIASVAKGLKFNVGHVLDMLAGDISLVPQVEAAIIHEVKMANLKEILEAALAKLEDGGTTDAVQEELLAALKGDESEETEQDSEETSTDTEETEETESADSGDGKETGKESSTEAEGTAEGSDDAKPSEADADDGYAKLKADFQDCVSAMVPKLLAEGKEQDEAVAIAISKCQEQGKCQLTPESKSATFAVLFESLDKSPGGPVTFTNGAEIISFVKQVDETAQSVQAPTTPIKTEPAADDFGNPFLESSKQTNVLLGALINEIQKLSSKFDGVTSQNSVQSTEDTSKDQEESTETVVKPETEDQAEKRLSDLNLRLKNLGC